ncbi:MAG TPA: NAD(P)-dependent oxidoreductase [Propionibacteriaceae bacterium]
MTNRFRRTDNAPYLAGLRLHGRRVVVVGAGAVAERRIPLLVEAGARVRVIAPHASALIQRWADGGHLELIQRDFASGDLAEAWYVLAATNAPEVNASAAAEAERGRTFCVRADDAYGSSAWTPATAEVDGVLVGVLAGGDPRRAVRIRSLLVETLTRLTRRAA